MTHRITKKKQSRVNGFRRGVSIGRLITLNKRKKDSVEHNKITTSSHRDVFSSHSVLSPRLGVRSPRSVLPIQHKAGRRLLRGSSTKQFRVPRMEREKVSTRPKESRGCWAGVSWPLCFFFFSFFWYWELLVILTDNTRRRFRNYTQSS